MPRSRKFCQAWSLEFLLFINIFHRGPYGPKGSNWFSQGLKPDFLRNTIATCDFPGEGGLLTFVPAPEKGYISRKKIHVYCFEHAIYKVLSSHNSVNNIPGFILGSCYRSISNPIFFLTSTSQYDEILIF